MSSIASAQEGPLYIRWGADRAPFAVEMKLDLVKQIRDTLADPENSGIEVGGVLIGSLPTSYSAVIRIESIEMIPRSPHDGLTFMLDPGQQDRFAEVRWRSRERDRIPVGMFRSHLRSGPLGPSLADRTLLTSEFPVPVYALLLVQANDPHSAAIYIAAHGQLPVDPSIRALHFDEREFRALPEFENDSQPKPPQSQVAEPDMPIPVAIPESRNSWRLPVLISALALVLVAFLFLFTDPNRLAASFASIFGSPQHLELTTRLSSGELRISWNHLSRDLDNATGALLTVKTPGNQREVSLGLDELRLGSVFFETGGATTKAEVTLTLTVPGSSPISQTVYWGR